MHKMTTTTPRRTSITIYYVLACAISWVFMIPAITLAAKYDYALPTAATIGDLMQTGFKDARHIWLALIGTLSSYGPLIAALILTKLEGGDSLTEWWRGISNWRNVKDGYRALLVLILAIFLPLVAIGLILGPFPTSGMLTAPLTFFLPYALYELLTSGMEEPGWRGYALPRLQERYTARKSSLILGILWGIWHWPAFIPVYFNVLNESGVPVEAFITATIQVLIYTVANILAASFIHTWLYNRTKGAFLNILLHGGSNAIGGYILAVIPNPSMGLVYGAVRWAVAIVLIRYFWKNPDTV